MKKLNHNMLVYSNICYLIVWWVGIFLVWYFAIPMLLLSAASFFYHMKSESEWGLYDAICAWMVILCNVIMFCVAFEDRFVITWTIIALVSWVLYWIYAHKARSTKYELYHSVWHIATAVATFLIYLWFYLRWI